ncbi:hypothetical protein [Aliidiomarina minuta]|nr:hypothetical protein [Aliidiomarina minuta]
MVEFEARYPEVMARLDELHILCVTNAHALPHDSRAREYLLFGAGRRISVLRRAMSRIFETFPLRLERPLPLVGIHDVQIYLQAYVINLFGLFDNLAWAFVLFHDLEDQVGGKFGVGFQRRGTQRFLPQSLRDYVTNEQHRQWNENYLKSYRDALAHRIPLYIPLAQFTPEEGERFNELESEKARCIREHDFERLEQMEGEQRNLGKPMPAFLHSFEEDGARSPVLLHPQLLSDAMAVSEFGELFFDNWQQANRS